MMILELADFCTDDGADFEAAMHELSEVIAASPGYLGHSVHRSIESPGRFVLLTRWESVEAHMVGFRESPAFRRWKERIADHRSGLVVEHLETVLIHDPV